jgi:hypothetical protein
MFSSRWSPTATQDECPPSRGVRTMAGVFYTPAAEETAAVSVRVAVHSGCTAQLSAPQLRARPPTRSSHAANAAHARMLRLLALTGSPREGLCSAARLASRLGHFDGDGGRQPLKQKKEVPFHAPMRCFSPCALRASAARTHRPRSSVAPGSNGCAASERRRRGTFGGQWAEGWMQRIAQTAVFS